MRPPYHPAHVEAVHTVDSQLRRVRASCSCGWRSADHRMGQAVPTAARLLADELNIHRATYVKESARA